MGKGARSFCAFSRIIIPKSEKQRRSARKRIELHTDAASPSSLCGAVRKSHYQLPFRRSFVSYSGSHSRLLHHLFSIG